MEVLLRVLKISILFLIVALCQLNAQGLEAKFEIKNFGLPVDGVFRDTETTYKFETEQLSISYFKAEIKVKSIDTGIKSRDRHLLEEKYFNEEEYPTMRFESTSLYKNELGFMLAGKLTIKGKMQNIETPLELIFNETGPTVLSTQFTIDRRDFGVGKGSLVLGDEVTVMLKLQLK